MRGRAVPAAIIALLGALGARSVSATTVAIHAHSTAGTAASDLLVMLDPLDATPPPSHDHAVIDQVHKQFVPKVSIVRTGTAVTLPNSDQIRHQVYSFSPAKTFNLKLYARAPPIDVVFDKPGLVVLGCDIHDTMVAFVGVVDTPYFGKVPASGELSLEVPPGHYRLRLWHPALVAASAPSDLIVGAAPISLALTLTLDENAERIAPWP